MPELPEVETLRRALIPLVRNKTVKNIYFFRPDLRLPIPEKQLRRELTGARVTDVVRRGKYLLLHTGTGAMLWHLGMSGRVVSRPALAPREKHTHAVFQFAPDVYLHFIDPRRFGCILWAPKGRTHPLLADLGPEPLDADTTAAALKEAARGRKTPIKSFLMDSRRLVGVGNIYACESLFKSRISPRRAAGKITLAEWEVILAALRQVLNASIARGGTTLRDFYDTGGNAGYYAFDLAVYGKEKEPCPVCATPIARIVQSGRSTFFCKKCQK